MIAVLDRQVGGVPICHLPLIDRNYHRNGKKVPINEKKSRTLFNGSREKGYMYVKSIYRGLRGSDANFKLGTDPFKSPPPPLLPYTRTYYRAKMYSLAGLTRGEGANVYASPYLHHISLTAVGR